MPLVILGIIVVVGACLMIYYQIGPSLKSRAGRAGSISVKRSSSRDAFGGYIHVEVVPELDADTDLNLDSDSDSDGGGAKPYNKSGDGKVLYVFNGGKTEIRPLDEKDAPAGDAEGAGDSDDGDIG
jgi:hypothetical protein